MGRSVLATQYLKAKQKLEKLKRNVIAGFAGSTADALRCLKDWKPNLKSVETSQSSCGISKRLGSDKYLRRLEALMAVADKEKSFIISGTGDVLEPEDGIIGIGSGGNYALQQKF